MKFNKLFLVGALALAAFSGCGSSSNDAVPVGSNAVVPAADEPARGTPASTMDISERKLWVDGIAVDRADDNTFMGYPVLASRVAESWLATKAVMTTEGNLEIYENGNLLFIINSPNSAPAIAYSRNGFMADSISWTLSNSEGDQGQTMHHGLLKFELSECTVEEPDQGQDKGEQDKGDQDKGDQDKGDQDKGEQEKPVKEEPVKEEPVKEEPKAPVCKRVTVELSFMEVITKEPDQGQDKGDQDKGEQDKGDQDKGDQDKGDQDKGDQDKGDQDKGDQDKGEQDKGQKG